MTAKPEEITKEEYGSFLSEIKARIAASQYAALKTVNKELIALYLDLGHKLVEKQEWGESVVETLSKDLQLAYPGVKGFSIRNLWNMRNFYSYCEANPKLQPLVAEISWTKNLIILERCKDALEREFYIKMTKKFGWSKNVLIHQIEGKSYEKFLLNQTNFDGNLLEKYKDQAKLAVKVYHRKLKSLIAIELKVGKFKPEYAGKMQFYLSVLNDRVKMEDENPSIGIIICKEKSRTVVEYALKDSKKPIGIATYKMTSSLPDDLSKYLPSAEKIVERMGIL